MPTAKEMQTSLDDAAFFNDKIQAIVRGPQQGHDLTVVRRYFRAYLHCWKTVLHFVRDAKGLTQDKPWIAWCKRWQNSNLNLGEIEIMEQLRETRDFDTHTGTLVLSGEVAGGLFPLVFVGPVKQLQSRMELATITIKGLEILTKLIANYASTP